MSGKALSAVQTGAEAPEINFHIGKRLKLLRVTHGESQETLGRSLGLTFQQVQKYERGTNKLSADKLWRIAQRYGVEVEFFFEGIEAQIPHAAAQAAPASSDAAHDRLRLEIGREARDVSPAVLRSVLNVMRAVASRVSEPAVSADD
ncbi:MAG TPA: helix-turn-helix transcriptional regulator [Aliidongia sp.]|nr:helix-turn-helix transcriptional regulator [Aliidongia sp.]